MEGLLPIHVDDLGIRWVLRCVRSCIRKVLDERVKDCLAEGIIGGKAESLTNVEDALQAGGSCSLGGEVLEVADNVCLVHNPAHVMLAREVDMLEADAVSLANEGAGFGAKSECTLLVVRVLVRLESKDGVERMVLGNCPQFGRELVATVFLIGIPVRLLGNGRGLGVGSGAGVLGEARLDVLLPGGRISLKKYEQELHVVSNKKGARQRAQSTIL